MVGAFIAQPLYHFYSNEISPRNTYSQLQAKKKVPECKACKVKNAQSKNMFLLDYSKGHHFQSMVRKVLKMGHRLSFLLSMFSFLSHLEKCIIT